MIERQIVHDWLLFVSGLNVGGLSQREVELRLAVLAPALAEEFDAKAFTPESARYVAGRCTHFPVFGEIVPLLQTWQRESKLSFGMLLSDHRAYEPPPPPPERTEEELNHVQKLTKQVVAELQHQEAENRAHYAAKQPVWRAPARQLTRAELTEAYKRAGIKGPELPKPPLRVVAVEAHAEVRRGPVMDDDA